MSRKPLDVIPVLLHFLVAAAAWAAWLGWDQHRDVHPDGSVTGPYEAWQVIGLMLTLSAFVAWGAFRGHPASAVLGTTVGLTAASYYDWSDDASGLFALGVGMIAVGTLAGSSALTALVAHVIRDGRGRGA
ncbi:MULTISPECIES: hypothetical protein [unclassified Streptomyces]|uniref:hypothetical protein n=1 Tax=unclassified Streptomyces TaxID=2593676 RepID=UPI002E10EF8D|nr:MULTISPECIES: hypothetical protein [unclassified Streptomyces]WSR23805.1 hypothetical protein OG573_35245 [Streptomyces sp. NBC_01205]